MLGGQQPETVICFQLKKREQAVKILTSDASIKSVHIRKRSRKRHFHAIETRVYADFVLEYNLFSIKTHRMKQIQKHAIFA